MKTPRKVYILVSKSRRMVTEPTHCQAWVTKKAAKAAAKERNEHPHWAQTDWRVETFVKGD